MKTYKQLNGVMGDIRDAVHHAYDLGYKEGKDNEKVERLEKNLKAVLLAGERTTKIIPDPSSIGLRFRCQQCHETMVAQYPFCPWCGRIDIFIVENKKYEKENEK